MRSVSSQGWAGEPDQVRARRSCGVSAARRGRWILGYVLAAAGALAACGGTRSDSPPPVASDFIRLERTACLGHCPVYVVEVRGDGTVVYEGLEHVAVMGPATARIDPTEATALFEAVGRSRFFQLEESYDINCPSFRTCAPSAVTTVQHGTRRHVVRRNFGCEGLRELKRLDALCERIDAVAGTSAWTGR